MFPVFTRPLGLMKGIFSAELTVNARIDSARVPALDAPMRSLETTPLGREEGDMEVGAAFVLTRSAHDFGSALGAGAAVTSSACADAASCTAVSELLAASDVGGEATTSPNAGSFARLDCDADDGLRAVATGTFGMMGTTGRVGVLAWL
jgi:hypothetical protein